MKLRRGEDDFTKRLLTKYHRLTFEPGSRYAYSNLGYLVLGQVIERISGQRYTDYIQQHILEVLDMHRTGFAYDSLQNQDVATGYVRPWSMMGILGRLLVDRRIFGTTRHGYTAFRRFLIDGAPYGGLLGPVSELGNFLKAYLNGGIFQGHRLLEPSSIAEMLIPQRNQHGEELSTSGHEMPRESGWDGILLEMERYAPATISVEAQDTGVNYASIPPSAMVSA